MCRLYQGRARVFKVLYRDELIDIYKTLFQINILQLFDFSKFLCGLGEEFPTLSMRAFEVIVPFQNSYLFEAGLSSIMTIKQNIDLNWFPRMAWDYLFHPLYPESQILCVENKHKSLPELLTGWRCLSFFNERKMAVYSFFQTFRPFIQWYAGLYETVFRISTTSANHLKVFMLACKSILWKFHLRNR